MIVKILTLSQFINKILTPIDLTTNLDFCVYPGPTDSKSDYIGLGFQYYDLLPSNANLGVNDMLSRLTTAKAAKLSNVSLNVNQQWLSNAITTASVILPTYDPNLETKVYQVNLDANHHLIYDSLYPGVIIINTPNGYTAYGLIGLPTGVYMSHQLDLSVYLKSLVINVVFYTNFIPIFDYE